MEAAILVILLLLALAGWLAYGRLTALLMQMNQDDKVAVLALQELRTRIMSMESERKVTAAQKTSNPRIRAARSMSQAQDMAEQEVRMERSA